MRRVVGGLLALVAALALAQPAAAGDRTLERYAEGTWRSFEAMTDAQRAAERHPARATARAACRRRPPTSAPTCGAPWWPRSWTSSAAPSWWRACAGRSDTLEDMERHAPSGQFYNWYDHRTGEKLTTWPPSGEPLDPALSSVDNGWLAVGLKIVAERIPELSRRADALYDSMDFGFYYRPDVNRMLFHYEPDTGVRAVLLRHDRQREPDRRLHRHRQGRGARARALRAVPRRSPTRATGAGPRRGRSGFTRTYFGTTVYDGSLPYAGMLVTPSWGGSMFEALMPALFLPEERWAPGSWGANHPLTAPPRSTTAWWRPATATGASRRPTSPRAATRVYGVDGIGSDPNGYPSNNDRTLIDHGWPGCPAATRSPTRRRAPTPTASSPRTRRSSPCATRRTRRSPIWPARARLRHLHALGLPRLGQRRHAARCRTPTCRSTRA